VGFSIKRRVWSGWGGGKWKGLRKRGKKKGGPTVKGRAETQTQELVRATVVCICHSLKRRKMTGESTGRRCMPRVKDLRCQITFRIQHWKDGPGEKVVSSEGSKDDLNQGSSKVKPVGRKGGGNTLRKKKGAG